VDITKPTVIFVANNECYLLAISLLTYNKAHGDEGGCDNAGAWRDS
jgi:hypothetical protein